MDTLKKAISTVLAVAVMVAMPRVTNAATLPYVTHDFFGFYTVHIPEASVQVLRDGGQLIDVVPGLNLIAPAIIAIDDLCGKRGVHMSGHVAIPVLTPPLCGE